MWVPVWGGRILRCQRGCELSNTKWWLGPSSGGSSQSAPALPKNTSCTVVHFLDCHRCVWVPYHTWVFKDGSFLYFFIVARRKLCWRKALVLAFFAVWWTCGDHVCLWRYTPVYFAVSVWQYMWQYNVTVSRVGGNHCRLLSSATQLLSLMWMGGHKPLSFPMDISIWTWHMEMRSDLVCLRLLRCCRSVLRWCQWQDPGYPSGSYHNLLWFPASSVFQAGVGGFCFCLSPHQYFVNTFLRWASHLIAVFSQVWLYRWCTISMECGWSSLAGPYHWRQSRTPGSVSPA